MARLLVGKPILEGTYDWAREEVKVLEELGVTPGLAVLLLNDDPAELETQRRYVELKARDVRRIGGYVEVFELHGAEPVKRAKQAIALIERLNRSDEFTGILVQKPLPPGFPEAEVMGRIDPRKDVDALTPDNKKLLLSGYDLYGDLLPCTAAGIVELFMYYGIDVEGAHVAVVGRSDLVGLPLSLMLLRMNATVTVLHSRSRNVREMVRKADIVISAVGRPPELYGEGGWRLAEEDVREGAVVIGVGGKRDPATGTWYFDVDESVARKASAMTPNVGGVGPVTRARLLRNLVISSRNVALSVAACPPT